MPIIIQMPSILVVDDEHHVRQVVCIALERAGYTVREARDGEEALELYRENPSDVVVTDLIMEPMGGLELISHLRREFPKAKIIAMSAYMGALASPLQAGADKALKKPFSIEDLRSVIEGILDTGVQPDSRAEGQTPR
jgi:CheY-like chemotaxis protein